MNDQHDPERLAAYAIGLLDADHARAVEAHIEGCPDCRQELAEWRVVDGALRTVPPEMFLDGPPQDGELMLARTLRQVREERVARSRRRRLSRVAAAVALLVGVGAAGVVAGVEAARITAAPAAPTATGSRLLTGFDQTTGAQMTVTVTPAAGWVRIKATVSGIPAGERCMLVVVDRNRNRFTAASWLVSPAGERSGTVLDGAAVVAPADVAAIAVQNFERRELVIAPA